MCNGTQTQGSYPFNNRVGIFKDTVYVFILNILKKFCLVWDFKFKNFLLFSIISIVYLLFQSNFGRNEEMPQRNILQQQVIGTSD